jgi:hypothetical protein
VRVIEIFDAELSLSCESAVLRRDSRVNVNAKDGGEDESLSLAAN